MSLSNVLREIHFCTVSDQLTSFNSSSVKEWRLWNIQTIFQIKIKNNYVLFKICKVLSVHCNECVLQFEASVVSAYLFYSLRLKQALNPGLDCMLFWL